MKLYQVQAYRYGQLNAHQYTVAIHRDKARALHVAQAEVDDRAGKYGVAIYEWDDSVRLQDTYNRIGYYESLAQEGEPYFNQRIDVRGYVGSAVLSAYENGHYWDGKKRVDAELPEWLRKRCETQLKAVEVMLAAQEPNDDN